MRHFSDRKDVNLVVGAVLLIAVMVVLSVVIDAWSGKTVHSAQTEELTVSSFTFSNGNMINIVVENNGTVPSGIAEVWIDNGKQHFTANSTIIEPCDYIDISIGYGYSNGTNYHFKMISERGSNYFFTAIAL
jgi:FlaG/FlaF family flagellin (archaellin)